MHCLEEMGFFLCNSQGQAKRLSYDIPMKNVKFQSIERKFIYLLDFFCMQDATLSIQYRLIQFFCNLGWNICICPD